MSSSYQQVPILEPSARQRSARRNSGDLEMGDLVQEGVEIFLMKIGKPNESVFVDLDWTVLDLKKKYFGAELDQRKNIRLIFSGKMLADDVSLNSSGIKEKSFIHVSISDYVGNSRPPIVNNFAETGQELSPEEEDYRLAMELAEMERNFEIGVESFEEREGHRVEFFLGFVIAYMLGPIMLIWVWQPRVSKRLKFGILIGVGLHILNSIYSAPNAHHEKSEAEKIVEGSK